MARAGRMRTVPRSLRPTGTESRKREIGFMGLVLGGRERESGRGSGREALLPAGKLVHGAEQKTAKWWQ